ncbi:MAG: DUF5711 family protein [Clostridia bacterium]|nr:DUF5711 family protein [Clostridia bacterium]
MPESKHFRKKEPKVKEVIIREKSGGDYYDNIDEDKARELHPHRYEARHAPNREIIHEGNHDILRIYEEPKFRKALPYIIVLSVLVILGVSVLMMNRSHMTAQDLWARIKVSFVGSGIGDGFPVDLNGSGVEPGDFISSGGKVVTLSSTSLTELNITGKELFSIRHNYVSPLMCENDEKFLIYDCGGTNYMTVDSSGNAEKRSSENTILSGAVASNGRYALTTFPIGYSSQVEIFEKNGKLKYSYKFSDDYANAVCFNEAGDMVAVAAMYSRLGEIYTRIVIIRFDSEKPVAEYIFTGNMVQEIYWSGKYIYVIGDEAVAIGTEKGNFTEYSYGSKRITATHVGDGKCFVSVSGYEFAGASSLLIFSGTGEPLRLEFAYRIESISSYGNVCAVLADHTVFTYNTNNGELRGSTDAGSDSIACALQSNNTAFILAGKEIRYNQVKSAK